MPRFFVGRQAESLHARLSLACTAVCSHVHCQADSTGAHVIWRPPAACATHGKVTPCLIKN